MSMSPEQAQKLDDAKRHAVSAKVHRDALEQEYFEAVGLTDEEHAEWFKKIGQADRALQEYREEIRSIYRKNAKS